MPNMKMSEESKRELARARCAALISMLDEEIRPTILAATGNAVELLKESFPEADEKMLAAFSGVLANALAQVGQVPAFMLSESIEHSVTMYTLAGSVLTGVYELPEVSVPADATTPDLPVVPAVAESDYDMSGPYL